MSLVLRLALALLRARGGSLASRRRRRRCPVGVCKKDLRVLVERAIAIASSMAFGHGRRPPYKDMHVVGVVFSYM